MHAASAARCAVAAGPLDSVKAQLVDSAPGTFRLQSGWSFCWAMTGRSRAAQLLLLVLFPVVALLFLVCSALSLQCVPRCSRELAWKRSWAAHSATLGIVDTLLLFSNRGDRLIDSGSVREFADMLDAAADRGMAAGRVVRREWERTEHVAHYRSHPEEYREALEQFLKSCAAT